MIQWITDKSHRRTFTPGQVSLEAFLDELASSKPYTDWVYCWSTVLVTCLNKKGIIEHPLFIEAPAIEKNLVTIERKLRRPLPSSLRDTFLNFSECFGFRWKLSSGVRLTDDVQLNQTWGGFFKINLKSLPTLADDLRVLINEREKFGDEDLAYLLEIDRNALPFYAIGNGDMLAIDLREEDGNVIYLALDSGPEFHGMSLGCNFVDFMSKWSQLGCVGPEEWILEHFLTKSGFNLDSKVSGAWRRWIGLIN